MKMKQLTNVLSLCSWIAVFILSLSAMAKNSQERSLDAVLKYMHGISERQSGDPISSGPQFDIHEELLEAGKNSAVEVRLFKGYYRATSDSPRIYFEYRLPKNYNGTDAVEAAGFSKDSSYWAEPNQKAGLLETGYGVLTFDGWVRGHSLGAIPKQNDIPSIVSTHAEARLLKQLVESLGLNRLIVIGHSRGAGITAKLSQLILKENGPDKKTPVQILSHYDLNGLVSYVSSSFPLTSSMIFENFMKELEDGSIVEIKLRSSSEYYQELLSQWTQFEKEYLDRPSKYNSTFLSERPGIGDAWDPSIKELTAGQLNELVLKFPLLVQSFSSFQGSAESYMINNISKKTANSLFDQERDHESLKAMMRGLRTVFYVSHYGLRKKYFIPHSVLPSLVEIAKAGIPVKVLYAENDDMVLRHHFAIKKDVLKDLPNVEVIRDTPGHNNGYKEHFGPNRLVWENTMAAKIRGHVPATRCHRAHR